MPPPAASSLHPVTHTLSGADGLALAATAFAADAKRIPGRDTLLFGHGFGQTRGAWLRSAQALATEGYSGLAYDMRGHGESGRNPPEQRYAVQQFADDMIVVAGELAQPPVLVGASMGGLCGLITEARWPGLFRALVLVDVTPRWEQAGMLRILSFMTAFPNGFDSLEHAVEIIAAYLPHRRNRKSPEALRELLRRGEDQRWRWHWDARLIEELASGIESHQDALAEAARAVRCPVLLISGGRSDLVSPSTVGEFQALVPHARHVHLPQATHMLAGDDSDAFTRTVLEYLHELPAIPSTVTPLAAPSLPAITQTVSGARP